MNLICIMLNMKYKIAIFGDSYADESTGNYPNTSPNLNEIKKPWVSYLRQMCEIPIINYAVQGSSLYFSADLILKQHNNFDKIIFIITQVGRTYMSNIDDDNLKHISNLDHLNSKVHQYKSYIKQNIKGYTKENLERSLPYLNALKYYYQYIYNFEQLKLFHEALIDKIYYTVPREKILYIPYGQHSKPPYYEGDTLTDISGLDNRKGGSNWDLRCNHMNDSNNRRLASKVNNWIKGNSFNLSKSDFVKPTESYHEMFNDNDWHISSNKDFDIEI